MLPDDVDLTLTYEPELRRSAVDDCPAAHLRIRIREGEIQAMATVDTDADVQDQLFFAAYDIVRTLTDIASVSDGVAYIPLLEEVAHPSGEIRRLVLADRRLADRCTAYGSHDIEAIADLAISEPQLARALSDVAIMLSWPHYVPIAAGRVLESIVHMVAGGKSAAHWDILRSRLNVNRAYLDLLTEESKAPRHGNRRYVPGPRNRELAERAWTLMDRYITYRFGGCAPLDPVRFPVLAG
ncbi:MAG: hypothetical protein WDN44_14645 [Sphingomonas sp.]